MTQRTWPHPLPLLFASFLDFRQNASFPKKRFKDKKKQIWRASWRTVKFIFNYFLLTFFPLLLWITVENRTRLRKLFIWTSKSGETPHHKHTNCIWLFKSNCNNASDILGWAWFLHYSDCRSSFNNKLKTNEIFLQLSKYTVFILRIPLGKTSCVYWYVFPFHLVQYSNIEFV